MEYLIIVIVLVVLALIAGGAMLVRGRRRPVRISAPPAPPAPSAPPPAAPAGQDVDTTTVTSAPAPVAEAPAAEPAVQPLAGRMTRLRGRLARSQTGFGAVLLGLLSRDGLDDQGWEEIEDILVGADLGAAPAAQIVSELRKQVRVGGAKGSTEVRSLLRQDLIEQVGADMDRVLDVRDAGPLAQLLPMRAGRKSDSVE